jgi:hypothetical protein
LAQALLVNRIEVNVNKTSSEMGGEYDGNDITRDLNTPSGWRTAHLAV